MFCDACHRFVKWLFIGLLSKVVNGTFTINICFDFHEEFSVSAAWPERISYPVLYKKESVYSNILSFCELKSR